MNEKTRKEFQEFLDAICQFAHAVSSVAGTDAVQVLFDAAVELHKALENDETVH